MAEYATCECAKCYRRVPKPDAHRTSITREKGHTSGSFRFSRRSISYYTGRTYYAKQDVWICHDCYTSLVAEQKKGRDKVNNNDRRIAVAAVNLLGIGLTALANNADSSRSHPTPLPTRTTGSESANYVRIVTDEPPTAETTRIQAKLIELGFLSGAADGVWGPKSRTGLRAFKIANGLPSDDAWDDLAKTNLFSARAVRAPAPLADNPSRRLPQPKIR
jgi:hypothetical protein